VNSSKLCRGFYADLANAGPLGEILERLQRRRRGENVPAPLALELSARPCIMKITKRTQSKTSGSYSKAIGSSSFADFFAIKKNPKLPISRLLNAFYTAGFADILCAL
jgi:hypothetical protein